MRERASEDLARRGTRWRRHGPDGAPTLPARGRCYRRRRTLARACGTPTRTRAPPTGRSNCGSAAVPTVAHPPVEPSLRLSEEGLELARVHPRPVPCRNVCHPRVVLQRTTPCRPGRPRRFLRSHRRKGEGAGQLQWTGIPDPPPRVVGIAREGPGVARTDFGEQEEEQPAVGPSPRRPVG